MSAELEAFFSAEAPEPDWADRTAVIDYLVDAERPFASPASFDAEATRELAGRVVERARSVAATLTNPFLLDAGQPWRERLGEVSAPMLVIHGEDDPLFPHPHGVALANEVPDAELLALERTGHEYPPPHTWDHFVPAILGHTSGG